MKHAEECALDLFPFKKLEELGDDATVGCQVDTDSISLTCSGLESLMDGLKPKGLERGKFQIWNVYSAFSDASPSSRINVKPNANYNPSISNRKKNQIGLGRFKNLTLFKVESEHTFHVTMHLLEDKVFSNNFSSNMLGCVCLAMNTALYHPEWINSPFFTEEIKMEWSMKFANFERFSFAPPHTKRKKAFFAQDHEWGSRLASMFHYSLCHYASYDRERYKLEFVTGCENPRNIWERTNHGISQSFATNDDCLDTLLKGCKYLVENAVFTAVAAGVKAFTQSKVMVAKISEKAKFEEHILLEQSKMQRHLYDTYLQGTQGDGGEGGSTMIARLLFMPILVSNLDYHKTVNIFCWSMELQEQIW
jgi:hypothetical protein